MKKFIFLLLYTLIFAIVSSKIYKEFKTPDIDTKGGFDMAILNYKDKIDSLSGIFKLSPDYLMALIMLESSGKKEVPVRFEKRIYELLLLTKNGKIAGFEQIKTQNLKSFSKKDLKKLASSYGPFQIMGYKSIELKIHFQSLIGENHLYWAIKWIDTDYGNYARNGDFKNAFRRLSAASSK